MLVCNCRGVTDGQIRKLVREGATSTGQIVRATGAGRGCGGCRTAVRNVVAQTVEEEFSKRQSAVDANSVGLSHSLPISLPISLPMASGDA